MSGDRVYDSFSSPDMGSCWATEPGGHFLTLAGCSASYPVPPTTCPGIRHTFTRSASFFLQTQVVNNHFHTRCWAASEWALIRDPRAAWDQGVLPGLLQEALPSA